MTVPTQKVEFGFTQSSPGVYVYQDISSYVRSVSIQRGLARELDVFQSGTADIVLDNNLRTFDPTYSSSPFNGQILPQAAVRVSSNGIVVFTGYVDSWGYNYQIVADATATMHCVDGTQRLSQAAIPVTTSFSAQNSVARASTVLGASYAGWSGGTVIDPVGVVDFQAEDGSFWGSSPPQVWDYLNQVATSEGGAVYVNAAGSAVFRSQAFRDTPTVSSTTRTNLCIFPSFVSATLSYLGNTWTNVTRSTAVSPPSVGRTYVGAGVSGSGITYTSAVSFVSNTPYTFSVYVYVLVAVRVQTSVAFYNGATAKGFTSSLSATIPANTWTRVSVTGSPTGAATSGVFIISKADDGNAYYVDSVLLEQSASADLYFDGTYKPADAGIITYTNAWGGTTDSSTSTLTTTSTYSPTTPNVTNLSDAGGTAIPYTDINVVYGSENTYNNVVILQDPGGGTAFVAGGTATNAANGSAYGIRTFTDTASKAVSAAKAAGVANYYLGQFESPEYRVQSITTTLEGLTGAQQTEILNQDVWGATKVVYTPSSIGSSITSNLQKIIGVSHEITPESHKVTWTLGTWGNKFRLDSQLLGIIGTNVLGY